MVYSMNGGLALFLCARLVLDNLSHNDQDLDLKNHTTFLLIPYSFLYYVPHQYKSQSFVHFVSRLLCAGQNSSSTNALGHLSPVMRMVDQL